MQQLTCTGRHQLEWLDVSDPAIEAATDAIVRPIAVATCDLDTAMLSGRAPAAPPFPFGHECVAEVVAVGADVRGSTAGDRVVVPFQLSCGTCDRCLRGHTGNCRSVAAGASYGLGSLGRNQAGMLSDFLRVPLADHMLVKAPAGIDPAAIASASDNIPDGWRTVAPQLADRPGAAVLIVGGGAAGIPFYAIDIARASGAARVDYLDTDRRRLDLAASLGASVLEGPPPRKHGSYPITVDASGDVAGLACALRSTEPDGVCTSIGIYFSETTPIPLLEMYTRGITFKTGRVHARACIPAVLDLVASGNIHPERVTGAIAPWEDAAEVLAHHTVKTVIVRN
jgi:alcohol dehydrogenase